MLCDPGCEWSAICSKDLISNHVGLQAHRVAKGEHAHYKEFEEQEKMIMINK